jgi:hypothetical protein
VRVTFEDLPQHYAAEFRGGPEDGKLLMLPEAVESLYFPSQVEEARVPAHPKLSLESYRLVAKSVTKRKAFYAWEGREFRMA